MSASLNAILQRTPVVPVVVIDDATKAIPLAEALLAGGINVIEITLRTPAALDSIEQIAKTLPAMAVGAGTVMQLHDAKSAHNAGAEFLVSPGSTAALRGYSTLPLLPGAMTISEMMVLQEQGFTTIKFFPAMAAGGLGFVKALAPVLPHILLCPTGGIGADQWQDWVAQPNVICVGGSWVASQHAIANSDFATITALAAQISS